MDERGFYHPTLGYWQVTGDIPDATLNAYPPGTTEVPVKPGAGWSFDGTNWVPPSWPENSPLLPLSARQLRLGLLKIGIKPSQVDAAIAGLPEAQREAAEIEWAYASQYQRDHYLIGLLAASFGLTEDAVDAAWRDAQAL